MTKVQAFLDIYIYYKMISIKHLNKKNIDSCYELDSNTISLWTKSQWENEFKKEGIEVLGLNMTNLIIGLCVFQIVVDEAQINYFVVNQNFREKGFGTYLMNYLIKLCEKKNINKLQLEVSRENVIAEKFYSSLNFFTVGIRRNYYRDGSDALLKEKILTTK